MNRFFVYFLLLTLLFTSSAINSPVVRVVKFDALEHLMTRNSEKVEIINFWATWCRPCIKELPYFQEVQNRMADQVNVTLISLDFVDVLNQKVIPFVEKRNLTPQVLLLDEIDYNSWIDKVDPSWSGAIPATLFINHQTGERKFHEGELLLSDIEDMLKELSN